MNAEHNTPLEPERANSVTTPERADSVTTPERVNNADAQRPELLSPAGSMDALRAAVQNGADAVYLGYGSFHARVRASGFSESEFRDAVRYCHLYGVRAYLTLNTLLTDRELPAALEQARTASRLGVDAVLVQDWGLFALLRACLPDLPVHASTQMSVFTSGGVRTLYDAGCTRIVAARECSRDDIAALCQGPAEIETFVHGALCMCYSGQCELSAVLGGRSGNRGRCAQPCRLPFDASARKPRPDAHDLSLKDLNLSARLDELRALGVACLKIEGRLKRPEYVALVTSTYARLLRERRAPSQQETDTLARAFSRSGFTDAYWTGTPGAAMFGTRTGAASDTDALFQQARETYERGGIRKIPVTAVCTIRAGDAARLTVRDADGHKVTVTGDVPESARTRPLTPDGVRERLSRTGDTPYVCGDVRAEVGDGLSLSVSAVNALRRAALDALSVRRTEVPARREYDAPPVPDNRYNGFNVPTPDHPCGVPAPGTRSNVSAPRYTVSVYRPEQLIPDLLALHPARVYLPLTWFDKYPVPDWLARADGVELCAILPRVWRDADEPALRVLLRRAFQQGVTAALAGNIGHVSLIHGTGIPGKSVLGAETRAALAQGTGIPDESVPGAETRAALTHGTGIPGESVPGAETRAALAHGTGARLYGDYGLNVTNARSAAWLAAQGLQSVCVSFELRFRQIRDMAKPIPAEALVYGRLPLMITENRPGGRKSDALTDRTGTRFPLLDAFGGRVELQNSRPLWLADRDAWKTVGLSMARLRFTTETSDACARVIRAYLDARPADGPFTRGLYERGVE